MLPADADAAFDRIAGLTRRALGVPTALVTLVDQHRQVFPGAVGLPMPWQETRETPLTHSFCQYVVGNGAPLIVEDARNDALLASNGAVDDIGVIAYAGMPLTGADGAVIGSLCAIDDAPRAWTVEQLADLRDLAAACSSELQLRGVAQIALDASVRAEDLLATMPVGYIAYDTQWRVTAANAEAARIVKATVQDLVGHVLWDLFPATVGSEFETIYRRVASSGVGEIFEYFYPEPLRRWYEIRVQRDQQGVSAYFVDVTTRREGETRADRILAAMPVGFMLMDEDWRILAANSLGAELAGLTVDALVGSVMWELFPALIGSPVEAVYRRVADTGVSEVVEAHYPEPFNAWYDVRAVAESGRVALYFHDVSDRHAIQALAELRAEHDRTVAEALQTALLTELPSVEGIQLAARYLTATGTERVGGDWYDAVVQPHGAMTVSIGDVTGHGIEAAANMGQLRAMLRGFLWDDDRSPARGVFRLDQAIRGLDGRVMGTLIAGLVETSGSGDVSLRWTNAGHPVPIMLHPDGATESLDSKPELMLGAVPDVRRSDHTRTLPPGSTLLLYTDGLIETRTESLAHGTEQLCDALTRNAARELPDLLDAVLRELRADTREDDVAVLAIRIDDRAAPADEPLTLSSDVRAPASARAYVAERAVALPPQTVGHALILVSELVTNAVLHGQPVITVAVELDPTGITVTVHDGGSTLPARNAALPDLRAPGGRGLPILNALASEWGVRTDSAVPGKDVWFRLRSGSDDPAEGHRWS